MDSPVVNLQTVRGRILVSAGVALVPLIKGDDLMRHDGVPSKAVGSGEQLATVWFVARKLLACFNWNIEVKFRYFRRVFRIQDFRFLTIIVIFFFIFFKIVGPATMRE